MPVDIFLLLQCSFVCAFDQSIDFACTQNTHRKSELYMYLIQHALVYRTVKIVSYWLLIIKSHVIGAGVACGCAINNVRENR